MIVSSTHIASETLGNNEELLQPKPHLPNDNPNSIIATSRDVKSSTKASEQKRGRRLRNYYEIPKFNRLDSGVMFKEDSSMTLWCSLPKNSKENIKECYINSPDGIQYFKTDKNFVKKQHKYSLSAFK